MRIAFKFCGSCNPEVDLARIGALTKKLAQARSWEVVSLSDTDSVDVLVLLCGCPQICIDKEGFRRQIGHTLLVAARRLGWQTVEEAELPTAIIKAIEELVGQGL